MLKQLLVMDGVMAVCRFSDDGSIIDSAGMVPEDTMTRLARFALWYRRMISGNMDLFSLFSQVNGWTPSRGWVVVGQAMTVCSVTNLVCLVERKDASINAIMNALEDASHD